MKSLIPVCRVLAAAVACTGVAQAQQNLSQQELADATAHLPKPEDPVVLPSDDEVAAYNAAVRQSTLDQLRIDGDGIDDLWLTLQRAQDPNYALAPGDTTTDSDGDGVSDYEEMLLQRSAVSKDPVLSREEKIAAVREARRQAIAGATLSAETQARVREILAPWIHGDVPSGIPGQPFSTEADIAEKRKRMGDRLPALELESAQKLEAGKAAADRLGIAHEFALPNGGIAVISGESNGLPRFHYTRNLVEADTISADNLWPGGSSGLALSGANFGESPIKLGVWEPSNLSLDHTEFATTNTTVDALDATTGWAAGTGGTIALNTTAVDRQQGTGCLNLTKASGVASVLYSRTQPSAVDFTDRSVMVWYFLDAIVIGATQQLAATNALELRFGSGSGAYWSRSFDRANLSAGWNLLSLRAETATSVTGSPNITACNYTALNITYGSTAIVKSGNQQRADFWRISNTRVTNMDRSGGTPGNHATHVTGTMAARGLDTNARGMAYAGDVHSRNSLNDFLEIGGIFSNSDLFDDIFASNHSYGENPGWTSLVVSQAGTVTYYNVNTNQTSIITIQPGTYGWWTGNLALSGTEDNRFGLYTNDISRPIDEAVYASGSLLPVWAAGNDRGDPTAVDHFETDPVMGFIATNRVRPADGGATGYDTMPPDSVAKNILTVGSVGDVVGGWTSGSNPQPSTFSDFGPTDDGRIKPDVVASGESVYSSSFTTAYTTFQGTSQAAPAVAGAAGLVVEAWQRFRGEEFQPPASLLKGLLIHTADDVLNPGPDYRSGWGLVNAEKAAGLVVQDETIHNGANLRTVLVQNGAPQTIPVKAAGNGVPLVITGCSTDPAGTPPGNVLDPTALMLVNDWNVHVTTTGAGPFYPFVLNPANPTANATTGVNTRDNVEQVRIASPVAGQVYNIVLGPATGETFVNDLGSPAPQPVALIVSGIQPDLAFHIIDVIRTGTDKWTLVWTANVGSTYRVATSTNLANGTWTDVTGDISATTTYVAREVTSNPTTDSQRFWRVRKL